MQNPDCYSIQKITIFNLIPYVQYKQNFREAYIRNLYLRIQITFANLNNQVNSAQVLYCILLEYYRPYSLFYSTGNYNLLKKKQKLLTQRIHQFQ